MNESPEAGDIIRTRNGKSDRVVRNVVPVMSEEERQERKARGASWTTNTEPIVESVAIRNGKPSGPVTRSPISRVAVVRKVNPTR